MALLEREEGIAGLRARVDDVLDGTGAFVLLTGAAGLGKTSLAREVFAARPQRLPGWWGRCDPLSTPQPLGPFEDIAQDHALVRDAINTAAPPAAIARLLREPTLVVIEDAHWLDEATADALVHLARRADTLRAMVVLTYRNEEVDAGHPMAAVLGALAGNLSTHRIDLKPLSRDAVATLLADTGLDVDEVTRTTGGNPFFVTEVAADPSAGVPTSVSAAVMARVATLDDASRLVLELTSLSPDGLEYDLVVRILDEDRASTGVDDGSRLGLTTVEHGHVDFTHELTRLALLDNITPGRRQRGHRLLLDALEEQDHVDVARLAHHADAAADPQRVLRYAPKAAEAAARRRAHRAAAAHLERAIAASGHLPTTDVAELWDRLGDSREQVDAAPDMIPLRERIINAWQEAGNPLREARQWHLLAGNHHMAADDAQTRYALEQASALVADLPDSPASLDVQWKVLSNRMTAESPAVLRPVLLNLLDRSRDVASPDVAEMAAAALPAMIELAAGNVAAGLALAEDAARAARRHRRRGYVEQNVAEALLEVWEPALAAEWSRRGIDVLPDDSEQLLAYARMTEARACLRLGDWASADELSEQVLSVGGVHASTGALTHTVVGRLRTRRGQPSEGHLTEADAALGGSGDLHFLWPLAAAVGEAALLDAGLSLDVLHATLDQAVKMEYPWIIGELGYLRWLQDESASLPAGAAEPWVMMTDGRWQEAAEEWAGHSCPYQRALALSHGDADAKLQALGILDELGAAAVADRLRAALRASGAANIPRRPTAGGEVLTARQLDVLQLVADGLTNGQIAERLFLSAKTVGHHVSAILQRLDVSTRTEAAAVARERGLLD